MYGFVRLGAIAQLGERLLCKQEVVGSIPSGSTNPGIRLPKMVEQRQAPVTLIDVIAIR